jgi:hypothetical protein
LKKEKECGEIEKVGPQKMDLKEGSLLAFTLREKESGRVE